MKILLTGATGFIGKNLGIQLVKSGHTLVCLVRNEARAKMELPFPSELIEWDGKSNLSRERIQGVEAIIHLAGESVAGGRWNRERKDLILNSRIQSTQCLVNLINESRGEISTFLCASAIGFYGDTKNYEVDESCPKGEGFLSMVCQEWERILTGVPKDTRVVSMRIGIVLGPEGGVLERLSTIFNLNLGSRLGDGKQWMSWIHIDDLTRAVAHLLKSPLRGAVNLVGPNPLMNRDFTDGLVRYFKRSKFLPVPSLALKALLGEMSDLVLHSQRVRPKKLEDDAFQFRFTKLELALNEIYPGHQSNDHWFIQRQWLPFKQDTVWKFFSDEKNLQKITPEWLDFKIDGHSDTEIRENSIIDYSLKIRGMPVKWRTLIENWQPKSMFVDRQLKGPYEEWHHTHSFEELGNGTLMTDRVRYRLPFGFLGSVGGSAIVKSEVQTIFSFRRKTLLALNLNS